MQLDRHSAVILAFPRASMHGMDRAKRNAALDSGRAANLALMLIVFALAALWLVFPPAQLPATAADSARNLLAANAEQ
jgi:hypothetical protein